MISDGDVSVSSAASMLHTSRSTFQYVKRAPCRRLKTDEIEKRKLIEKPAGENITYGYRRIWALVRRQDVFISRKRVRRMLKEMNLQREAHFPRPRLPQTGNLVSGVPDVRWYTDISAPRRKWKTCNCIRTDIKRPIWGYCRGYGRMSRFHARLKMGEGPPEPPCRWRLQTTVSCCGQKPWW